MFRNFKQTEKQLAKILTVKVFHFLSFGFISKIKEALCFFFVCIRGFSHSRLLSPKYRTV
jgi:hypothetical protein